MFFCCGQPEKKKVGILSDGPLDFGENDDKDEKLKKKSLEIEERIRQIGIAKKKRKTIFSKPVDLSGSFAFPDYEKTPEERKFIDETLGDNFIFSHLQEEERTMLINAMVKEDAPAGTDVIKQGDEGDFFYIIASGTIDFIADGNKVGSAGRGKSFGELALMYDAPRAATCRAQEDSSLWKVDQSTFRHILARQARGKEQGMCKVLRQVKLFDHLEPTDFARIFDALTQVNFSEGERIVVKGEEGNVFYILQEGTVKVHDIGLGDSQMVDQLLTSGAYFGERALLTGEPRAAHVTAVTDCCCLALSRENFEMCFGSLQESLDRGMRKQFLQSVPIFANSNFENHEMNKLVDLVQEVCYRKGQKLCEFDKPYKPELWIIRKGRIMVTSKNGKIYNLKTGDYFGDKSIRGEAEQKSSHEATVEENATTWVLSKEQIEGVIGDIQRLGEFLPFVASKANKSIKLRDLKRHKILGMGTFGKVWLVTHKEKGTVYALKQMDKIQLINAQQVTGVIREKNIMASIEHPFLLQLVSSFQDESSLYLLLDRIPGGELFNRVHTEFGSGLSRKDSVFYGACVIDAFHHLHRRNIVYRDLKPENVLIDAQGYAVVVDFGFAKIVVDKTYTLCGTPDYLPPEIILSKGHNHAADCWSFGVMIYELLAGKSPFDVPGTDQTSLFKRIVLGEYNIPRSFDADAKDLVDKLLVRRQAKRLGNLSGGCVDIQQHPFFKDIDFRKLRQKKLDAPWVPKKFENPLDSIYFDDYSSEERSNGHHGPKLTANDQEAFKDF